MSPPPTLPPNPNPTRQRLGFVIKFALSATALYFVFRKIDGQETWRALTETNVGFFALAVLSFNLSKVVAAFRFKKLLYPLGIRLSNGYNIRLLYISMFYNLFLPGSIGGDGYKVYLLKQQYDVTVKRLAGATLLDRLSGLALLVIMTGGFLLFSSFALAVPYYEALVIAGTLLVLPVFYGVVRGVFPLFRTQFFPAVHLSFWVQAGQVATAVLLLLSLSIHQHYLDYLTLFMVSSVVAVLPFTIGGVGARELVFLYGFQYLAIEQEKAITFTLLFFSVTALTSLLGLFVSAKHQRSVG